MPFPASPPSLALEPTLNWQEIPKTNLKKKLTQNGTTQIGEEDF